MALAASGCLLAGGLIAVSGPELAGAALLGAATVVAALTNAKALACVLVVLMPFTTPTQIFGIDPIAGFDPINLFVVLAMITAASIAPAASREKTILFALIGLNFGLITIGWYRTYGQGAISLSSLAIVLKPAIVVAAGFLAVRLIPRSEIARTLGTAMAAVLVAVGLSIIFQKAGIYQSPYNIANADRLGIKRFGGIMLEGNIAGSFVAMFTIPTYLILRVTGRARLGIAITALAIPVLLITLARGAMIAFAVSLIVLAIADSRRAETLATILAVAVLGVVWANTGGQSQVNTIQQNTFSASKSGNTNAQLSGRVDIWSSAFAFLNANQSRWAVGGGLDSFRDFVEVGPVKFRAASHNSILFTLVTGGVVMGLSFLLLLMWLIFARLPGDPQLRLALRIGAVAYLVAGMSLDMTLLNNAGSWIWLLAAAALVPFESTAETAADSTSLNAEPLAPAAKLPTA